MKNIIFLIQKYRNFLFFLSLEFISLFLLFSSRNSYHHYNYLTSSNSISRGSKVKRNYRVDERISNVLPGELS